MRIVSLSKYNAHTDPIFKELNILKVEDLFRLSLLKFQFKLTNKKLPHYFINMFDRETVDYSYNMRPREERFPVPNTGHAEKTVRYHLPIFIDSMPTLIIDKIETHSEKGFAHYAKIKFISDYSSSCNIQNCYVCNS